MRLSYLNKLSLVRIFIRLFLISKFISLIEEEIPFVLLIVLFRLSITLRFLRRSELAHVTLIALALMRRERVGASEG